MERWRVLVASAATTVAVYLIWQRRRRPALVLFDVDGTLAVPAQKASSEMVGLLAALRDRGYLVGIVGAGDFEKQQGQLAEGADLRTRLDFCFSENGVHSYEGTKLLHSKSMAEQLGEKLWADFRSGLDELLLSVRDEAAALLDVAAPGAKIAERGTFLEIRQCTVNVCIIGRTPGLSKAQRAAFDSADRAAGLRTRVVDELYRRFGPETPFQLNFSIGGQIGIDCAPVGWDKTFCLRFLPAHQYPTIHFFGDKTEVGGGDHELFMHPRTIGHTVTSPDHTMQEIRRLLL